MFWYAWNFIQSGFFSASTSGNSIEKSWLTRGKPSVNQLKKSILEFCGVKPVRVSYFAPIRNTPQATLLQWLDRAEKLGRRQH